MSMFGNLNKLNKEAALPKDKLKPKEETSSSPAPLSSPQIPPSTTKPSKKPTNERTFQRRKIRHTFDVFDDQLLSLREIALEREKAFGQRVLLGDLAQEALDMLIAKERNK